MKYVILIHSNPQPWGHPTGDFVAEFQALPQAQRERMNAEFEQMLTELSESGELLGGAALGAPRRVHGSTAGKREARWSPMGRTRVRRTPGRFFQIDVESQERAEELAARSPGPATVELRPVMNLGGDDQ